MGNSTIYISSADNMQLQINCMPKPILKVIPQKKISSYLTKRSSEELKSSRCSAYQYLIP